MNAHIMTNTIKIKRQYCVDDCNTDINMEAHVDLA